MSFEIILDSESNITDVNLRDNLLNKENISSFINSLKGMHVSTLQLKLSGLN